MFDTVDLSAYRASGEVVIDEEKFVENFIRRFAETVSMTDTYQIDFYDLYESPPKVSVKVTSATNNYNIANARTGIDIVNSIDLIVEFDSTTSPEPVGGCEYYSN